MTQPIDPLKSDARALAAQDLRWRAETSVSRPAALSREVVAEMTVQDTQLLFHELRVHQIELEMQNEELRRVQELLASERARYFDLYDLAPVGYCTVDAQGLILQANLTCGTLLGVTRGALVGKPFTRFIQPEDQDHFYQHRRRLVAGDEAQQCQLRMLKNGQHPVWVHLSGTAGTSSNGAVVSRIVISDIASLKHSEQQLAASEAVQRQAALHSQTILDNMLDGVITIDARGRIESFNQAAQTIFGYSAESVLGRNVAMLMPAPHRDHHDSYLSSFHRTGEARIMGRPRELEGQRQDGSVFPMSLSITRISRDEQPVFIGIVRDITQHREDLEKIRYLAFYDPLTGLPNRRLLVDRIQHGLAASHRTGHHGALMFMDLDHFKRVNDKLGHPVGDVLLQKVAGRLRTCVREGDSVARVGGDEFVVLLEALSNFAQEAATQAEAVANKILLALGQPFDLLGHDVSITPSVGIVLFMEDRESMDELLKKADIAMYQAKSAGRNIARFYDPAMQAAADAHADLEADMRRDLALNRFVLHYQVQVNQQGVPLGAEALVRWDHPRMGLLAPGQFIALAEESQLILPLGEWVLQTACAQLQTWSHKPAKAHWTLAVNVSALQFSKPSFVATVAQALHKTGAKPQLLKLELTESMLVGDVEDTIVKMNAIKALGVSFSLDDFGTGYSSLSYLKRLPLDQLKIDQSFVRDLLSDPNDAIIARTIVALGHSLGLMVIAEGVETQAHRDFLVEMGCDAFQGYLFGRPVPVADTAQWGAPLAPV